MAWFTPAGQPAQTQPAPEGTGTKPEPTPTATQVEPTPKPAPTPVSVKNSLYKRRRIIAVLSLLVGGAAFWYVAIPHGGVTPSLPENAAAAAGIQAQAITVKELARMDQAASKAHYKETGSFKGYKPQPGGKVQFAWRGSTALFSRLQDDQCVFYAVVGGKKTDIQTDPSGSACQPGAMRKAKAELGTT